MQTRRRAIYRALVTTITAAVFATAGYFGGVAIVDGQNRSQLTALATALLHRAEIEADFAFIGLGNLAETGIIGCDTASSSAMRQQVYVRGTIKDIRVIDNAGNVRCAAFPETLSFDRNVAHPNAALPARNTNVSVVKLSQGATASLGVLWRVSPDASLVAVVNTDALLFGAMPAALSHDVLLRLHLTNQDVVASFEAGGIETNEFAQQAAVFTAESERYPLAISMFIDSPALARWNRGLLPYFVVPATLLGLFVGALLAWLVVPRRSLLADIDAALAAGEIVPFVQPVVALTTGMIVGCEILARWLRPDGSIVPPHHFIPQIERSGRARKLTWTLLRQALDAMNDVLVASPNFTVAINVVPAHLLETRFAAELSELVSRAGVNPRQIVLELTERQELPDLAHAAKVIAELGRRGFVVAIDDAGTGHSGLAYVQSLGARILKLDKFFIDALETSHSARVVVEMLAGTAKRLKMSLVAEGIERQGQLAQLEEIGVEHGQGYLFGRAVPVASLLSDLRRQDRGAQQGQPDADQQTA